MPSKLKKRAGFTLTEVLIALAFLMLIISPILGMFVSGTRLTTASYKITTATVTAQLRMEELVGLTAGELANEYGEKADYNGYTVRVEPTGRVLKNEDTNKVFDNLIEVEVTVLDSNGSVLCTLTNILNVVPGGKAKDPVSPVIPEDSGTQEETGDAGDEP